MLGRKKRIKLGDKHRKGWDKNNIAQEEGMQRSGTTSAFNSPCINVMVVFGGEGQCPGKVRTKKESTGHFEVYCV